MQKLLCLVFTLLWAAQPALGEEERNPISIVESLLLAMNGGGALESEVYAMLETEIFAITIRRINAPKYSFWILSNTKGSELVWKEWTGDEGSTGVKLVTFDEKPENLDSLVKPVVDQIKSFIEKGEKKLGTEGIDGYRFEIRADTDGSEPDIVGGISDLERKEGRPPLILSIIDLIENLPVKEVFTFKK